MYKEEINKEALINKSRTTAQCPPPYPIDYSFLLYSRPANIFLPHPNITEKIVK
jgi:hypothetical protein